MQTAQKKIIRPETREEVLFQNTLMLLKNYHSIKWSLEISKLNVENRAKYELNMFFDEYLNSLYGAGVSSFDNVIESHAKTYEITKRLIDILDQSLQILKNNHPDGDELYNIIYFSFLYKSSIPRDTILAALASKGYYFSVRTYHRKRNEAIDILSVIIWGASYKNLQLPFAV